MGFVSINPFTGEKIFNSQFISNTELLEKIDNSKKIYYNFWKFLSVEERVKILAPLSHLLINRKKKYGELISVEMGKPISEAIAEVEKVSLLIDYYVENAEAFLSDKSILTEFSESYITYEPLGGILGIMPWNYPFWQVFRFAIPTLIAGNTVLLKHSPNMGLCALEIEKIFNEVIPEIGIYQNIIIDVNQVEELLKNDFIQGVSLTGSELAGKSVGALAGKYLKRSVLELGGNDAFIILEDSNIEKAIDQFILSTMSNNGQICIAAKRLLVDRSILKDVKIILINKLKKLKIGNPINLETQISCLARQDLKNVLNAQLDFLLNIGGDLLLNTGELIEGNNCSPILLEIDKDQNFKFDQEIFGPVALLIGFNNLDELVDIVNSSKYGLAVSIWSNNLDKAKKISKKIEVGNVAINKLISSDPRMPFGGIKNSGYGREMSEEGIKEFVNIKSVVVS